jgi:hypothetical protein
VCELADLDAILSSATTLAVKSAWSVPKSQQIEDSDFGGSPMLFSATIGGVNRQPGWGAVNKNGNYYVLDRNNLASGPVWSSPRVIGGFSRSS